MALPLVCAGTVALAYGALAAWRTLHQRGEAPAHLGDAFSPKTALILAGVLALVSLISAALSQAYGQAGLAAATALAGLADTHAPAVSVATLVGSGAIKVDAATLPILLALTTNTLTKCIAAIALGDGKFAIRVVPGLLLVAGAAWTGWWLR
jgi:uncharacterized membrane protein (DUF4010 family)